MFSKNISYQNFQKKRIISKKLKFLYKNLIERRNNENNLIKSFTKSFSYSFSKKQLAKYFTDSELLLFIKKQGVFGK